jgi:hypothetical protein
MRWYGEAALRYRQAKLTLENAALAEHQLREMLECMATARRTLAGSARRSTQCVATRTWRR